MKPMFDNFTAPRTDRRKFLIGLLFCSAVGVAALRLPDKRLDYLGKQKLEDLVPKTIGRWNFVAASGLVVPPNDQLVQTLYSQLLTRVYWDGVNSPVMLLMAQSGSQTGFLQVHRPEFCYTASGYHISQVTLHPIQLGSKILTANSMAASAGGPTEHVIYWTRVGNRLPLSWKEQKLAVAEQNLEGIIPDAILVRVSTTGEDKEAASAVLDDFIRTMLGEIPESRRSVFIV
jgi:EpsI family protein